MQAAGIVVVVVVELAAGMQPGERQLDTGQFVLGVDVHRQAPPVVNHLDGAIDV